MNEREKEIEGLYLTFCHISPPLVLAAEDSHSLMGGSDDACPYYWDMHHIVVGLPFLRLVWDFIFSLGSLRL